MRPIHSLSVALVACALLLPGRPGHGQAGAAATFGKVVIVGSAFEGDLLSGGAWVWSKGVTLTSEGLTLTCDTLTAWPTKTGHDFERLEAQGHVRVSGTYTAADKTKWTVKGSSESAGFDRSSGIGVLRGAVDFRAVNATTGRVLAAQADKLVYDQKTRKLRLERGEKPVRVEFEEPPQPAPAVPASGGRK